MNTSQAGLDLVAEFEGCVLHAYPDPATGGEPWTIGYGRAHGVKKGDTCTREQALEWLKEDVAWAEATIRANVRKPLNQHQFDALVSFIYNVGAGAFAASTMLRMINAGDYKGAAGQFGRWINGPNGPMPGLVRRRGAERAMFEKQVVKAAA